MYFLKTVDAALDNVGEYCIQFVFISNPIIAERKVIIGCLNPFINKISTTLKGQIK